MWCVVSTHASFLLDNSRQLSPKKLWGLKSLPGQQLLEHVDAQAASVTLLQRQPAELPSCHRSASSFIYSIIHHHSYIKKNSIVTKKSFKNFAKKKKITVRRKGEDENKGSYKIKLVPLISTSNKISSGRTRDAFVPWKACFSEMLGFLLSIM